MELPASPLQVRTRVGLSAFYFLHFLAQGFVVPFLPVYWSERGISTAGVGVLLALLSGAGALALVILSPISDRYHTRRPLIVGGAILTTACYLVYPLAHTFGQYALLQAIAGIGSTTSVSIASALGADVFDANTASRSFAEVRACGTLGFLLTMAIAYRYPHILHGIWFFRLTAGCYLGAALWTLLVRREHSRGVARAARTLKGAGRLLRDRNTLAFTASYFLFYNALMSSTAYMSLYLRTFRPMPATWVIPAAYAISAGSELPFLLVMGWVADHYGRMAPMRIAYTVLPLRLAGYALATIPATALALQGTHCVTFAVIAVVPFAFMNDITPRDFKATGQGILNAAGAVAQALGPLIAGGIAGLTGIRGLFVCLASMAAAGTLVFFGFVREPVRVED